MKAVILCAGRGTRLDPLTRTLPKALLSVANRPILAYQLAALAKAGIRDVGIVVNGGQADRFREAARTWGPADMRISTIVQAEPRGLADAVGCAKAFVGQAPFVLLLGDNIFTWELAPFIRRIEREGPAALLIAMRVSDPTRFGVITLDGSRVVDLAEKPAAPRTDLAVSGVYFLRPSVFGTLGRLHPSERGELELTDALNILIREGRRVEAAMAPGWCLDIGSFDSLLEANRLLLDEACAAPAASTGVQAGDSQFRGPVALSQGCKVIRSRICGPAIIGKGAVVRDSFVGPYTSVGDGASIVHSALQDGIILPGARVGRTPAGIPHKPLVDARTEWGYIVSDAGIFHPAPSQHGIGGCQ